MIFRSRASDARRAWKIYPAFYCLIAFTYLFELLVVGQKIRDRRLFSELLFIQSYQQGFWNHTWTLAVEEHFYLALPLVLLLLVRRNRGAVNPFRAVPYLVAGTIVLVLGARILNQLARPEYSMMTHVAPTHLRFDALFFGVAIGYAFHFHQELFRRICRPSRYLWIGIGVTLLGTVPWLGLAGSFYTLTFGFSHFYLGSGALLIGILMCDIPQNRVTAALALLGTFSYSIYLWHMALMKWAIPHLRELGVSWQLQTACYLVGAFVIGIAMARLLEMPCVRFRDRMFPSRSGTAIVAPSDSGAPASPARQAA